MLPSSEIESAFRKELGKPLIREENELGCSEIGFCSEKIVLRIRTKIEQMVNGDMVIGKIYHKTLKDIFQHTSYAKLHKAKFWLRPQFEKDVYLVDPRGFKLHGHCDIDIPAGNRIIEVKTTGSQRAWAVGEDFLTDAYVYQANQYAKLLGRKYWELWIIYKNFEDINTNRFATVLEGEVSEEISTEFLNRVANIFEAIKKKVDLMGPEVSWECKGCSYVKVCPYWVDKIASFEKALPATKAVLASTDDALKTFDMFSEKGWITYDRTAKVYRKKLPSDSAEVPKP